MRHDIRFLRRGKEVRLSDVSPTLTLLDYLRLDERATGTKEGCAEGDCGACTVVLRRLVDGELRLSSRVNACILLAGQVDGCEVITVEDLADGQLHPVQQAMVDHARLAMRLLHAGLRHGAVRALPRAAGQAARPRCGQRLDCRKSLPLHRLSPDRRCGAGVLSATARDDRFSAQEADDPARVIGAAG